MHVHVHVHVLGSVSGPYESQGGVEGAGEEEDPGQGGRAGERGMVVPHEGAVLTSVMRAATLPSPPARKADVSMVTKPQPRRRAMASTTVDLGGGGRWGGGEVGRCGGWTWAGGGVWVWG